ncbi:methionine--tRNA ligase [Streptomyces ipomoeae]|uniref:tRNA synthetase class I (M) n=2 Tax=Streptomyces ipomoeae TaxID=103232 RepID=L1KV12_9ACTN|nr:class I tRNA ligase family protein [Streptomyces ipomoeae]EKX64364.1 tRNA synthetase class I (M) [Streptomyces ipomoeae 91-03]MDX2693017.1 class I tRNA ligase family protein [Streptomyces ipomoeae]MDX2838523.1 class I tRNA ligase family protein [Streptomyces ipomoeae]MDX2934603.1 class I tRNA ligase family protein [Streptomyces ipomoeae]TQE15162.1 methionine--tRNA ligase [Streptomyces ipomoeae]
MSKRTAVISPAPTANGDLHLGHLAGPFLAADVFTRYQRAAGRETVFGTGAQDTSTFVVTTARRLGTTPQALVADSTAKVESTLAAMGIAVDGFTRDEERFTKQVLTFVSRLHDEGKLVLRPTLFPYSPSTGTYLVDGFVKGGCPNCLAEGCAGLCESCGHPLAAGDLIDPRSTENPEEALELREVPVLVLPLEEYRERLREYFASSGAALRPHMAQAVEEMLARPLPDFPVTYPISWGIPAPFPEVPGQCVNPNAETMAWSIYTTTVSAEARGDVLTSDDQLWWPESETEAVYFLGFDNTFPFAIAGAAMLLALEDRYALPARFVTNEFYELEHQKFSTSRGHLVWGQELADRLPRDVGRYHLAATSPENQRTNFGWSALAAVTGARLIEPWNRVAAKAGRWAGQTLPVSAASREAADRITERFAASYELDSFSLVRTAETLAEQLGRLDRWEVTDAQAGDFCHQVETVLRNAAPILIDLAERAGVDTRLTRGDLTTEITVRELPRLDGGAV